jgi:chemotaxis signal transduction protein
VALAAQIVVLRGKIWVCVDLPLFFKKRRKKFRIRSAMGVVSANTHDPGTKNFLVLFFKKERQNSVATVSMA